ncbi:MAG: phage tail tape measure protein [Magnetococcales bacterium]|nr:phage tail tape measure protein [Magnetococcales bacterium]
MADLSKTIEIVFFGNDKLSQSMKPVSEALTSASDVITDITKKMVLLEAAIVTIGTAFAVHAFNSAKKYETALVDLKKVLNEQEEKDLPNIQKAVTDLSETYGQSSTAILQSVADFRQAGYGVNEAMTLTKTAMDMVISGGVEAAQASEILIASLKGFEAPASDAGRVLDVLNEISNNYAASTKELGLGLSKLAPIAKLAGMSIEETAAVLTPVIEVYRSGTEAADALKTGLLKLTDNSKTVTETLEKIGVAQKDANGHLRSAKDILIDVGTAFKTADENDKLFLTSQLVGIDQAGRMVKVLDNMSKVSEITAIAQHANGSAAKEVAARFETAQVAVDRFAAAWENVSIAVGGKFLPEVKGVIDGATALEKAFRGVVESGTLNGLTDALKPHLKGVEDLFKTMAKNLPEALKYIDFSPIAESFGNLGTSVQQAFQGIFGHIDLSTIEGLHDAIQRVVNGIAALTNFTGAVIKGLDPVWEGIGIGITKFSEMDEATAQTIGNFSAMAVGISEGGAAIGLALIAIGQSGADMGRVFDGVSGTIGVAFKSVRETLDLAAMSVVWFAQHTASILSKITFGDLSSSFKSIADDMAGTLAVLAEKTYADSMSLQGSLGKVWDAMSGATPTIKEAAAQNANLTRSMIEVARAAEDTSKNMTLSGVIIADTKANTETAAAVMASLKGTTDDMGLSFVTAGKSIAQAGDIITSADLGIRDAVSATSTLAGAVTELGVATDTSEGSIIKHATAANLLNITAQDSSGSITSLTNAVGGLTVTSKSGGTATSEFEQSLARMHGTAADAALSMTTLSTTQADGTTVITGYGASVDDAGRRIENASSKAKEAKTVVGDLSIAFKNAKISAKVSFDTKALETDAKIAEHAFSYMSNYVTAQAKVMSAALESVGKASEGLGQSMMAEANTVQALMNGMEEMGPKRYEAQNMVLKSAQAEVEMAKAQTELARSAKEANDVQTELARLKLDNIRDGDALIKIDGTNLAPHLEAFMFEVLAAIQIRASAEGSALLLGA